MDQNIKEELLEMFHRGVHLLHRSGPHLRRQGRRSPMPPAQARLMRLLAATGPITQRDLSERLDIRSASLSELLGKLEKPGWIRRRPNETDKRTIDIELTEEGDNMLQNIGNERAEMAEEIFGSLTKDELRQLHSLLGKLIGDWETRFEYERPHSRSGRGPCGEGCPEHGGSDWSRRARGFFHHHGHRAHHGPGGHHGHDARHGHGCHRGHGGHHGHEDKCIHDDHQAHDGHHSKPGRAKADD